jgi:hypothetical protein
MFISALGSDTFSPVLAGMCSNLTAVATMVLPLPGFALAKDLEQLRDQRFVTDKKDEHQDIYR